MDDLSRELALMEDLCEVGNERLNRFAGRFGDANLAQRVVCRLVSAGLLELREHERALSLDEATRVLWTEVTWRRDDDRYLLDATAEGRSWWEQRDIDRLRRILATA
jgi:hypothetical protein